MKKTVPVLFLLIILPSFSNAQSKKDYLDSLFKAIKEDTSSVKQLINHSNKFARHSKDTVFIIADKAMKIATNIDYKGCVTDVLELTHVYRYILTSTQNDLQDLNSELKFIESYLFLVNIRFNDQIHFSINISDKCKDCYIPLLSLQLLVENAIKHNVVNKKNELYISIEQKGMCLEIKNNRHPKTQTEKSTGIGLQNIINRYKLLTDEPVIIDKDDSIFVVRLPLLNLINQ